MRIVLLLLVSLCLAGLSLGMDMSDDKHGVKMGIPLKECDDGKHGIAIDWNPKSREEYRCTRREREEVMLEAERRLVSQYIDIDEEFNGYMQHKCLNESIEYATTLPLSGNHRPLWPKFGEYTYLPPQRWVHSLEHGSVVLLYHPCMNGTTDLQDLKDIVKGCLRKHVISPYRKIPNNMPFALVAYEHARLLRSLDGNKLGEVHLATGFIKNFALKAPEHGVTDDGQYEAGLIHPANVVSDVADSVLCPGIP